MFKLQLWLCDKKPHFIKIIVKGMYLARTVKWASGTPWTYLNCISMTTNVEDVASLLNHPMCIHLKHSKENHLEQTSSII